MIEGRLARTLQTHVDGFAKDMARARRGDVRGVHQARVASRRLREALPVAAVVVSAVAAGRAARALRRLTRALGEVREVDVARGLLDEEAARFEWRGVVVARARRHLDRERAIRRARLMATVGRVDHRALIRTVRDISRAVARSPRTRAWREHLSERRRRRAARLRDRLGLIGTLYVPDRLHEVRIAVKKLRYSLELEREVTGRAGARDLRTLRSVQELLGRLHDLQRLQAELHAVARDAGHDRASSNGLRQMVADLEVECRALHASLLPEAARIDEVAARAEGA